MAIPLGNRPLPGYPMPDGDKYVSIFDHSGPASYTQFNSTTGAGGDVLKANGNGLNFGGIDGLNADVDTSGQWAVYPVNFLGGYGNSVPQVTLVWYSLVTATVGGQSQTAGTQAVAGTNLSTFSTRLAGFFV
jgi:hypothetical protein